MTITVEGPDGAIHEFPDGVSQDVIKGAMSKHYGSPTKAVDNQTPEQKTEKLGAIEKGVRAASYGLLGGAEGAMNTIGKAIGADPQKLAKVNMLINAGREAMGVTPEEYAPASAKASDPNASFGERMSYMPRALIESGAGIAAGAALGGLPGALATVAGTETGPTIDRVRAEDKTDPNAELTPAQKARVGGKVGLDMLMTALGGRATLGATAPVKAVGMEGVKQAAGNVVKAGAADALAGGGSAAADKMLIEGEAPSFNDVAVPALTGATLGTSIRAPGATREAAVSVRNRVLGDLNPQSRGEVADTLKHYNGNFDVTGKHIDSELRLASKGLDEVTKDAIAKAKLDIEAGKRVDPATIEAVTKADPDAGRVLQNLDTFSVMQTLNNGGLSNSFLGHVLNPLSEAHSAPERFASRLGGRTDVGALLYGLHDPTLAAGIVGTQVAGTLGLKAIDRLTGAANPAKVITDKFAGTAEPTPSVAQARAAVLAKDVSSRQQTASQAKAERDAARNERDMVNLDIGVGNVAQRNVENAAKARKAESDQLWKEATASVRALNKRDDLQSDYETGVARSQADQDRQLARQADIMRRSQAVEERRLADEDRAARNASRQTWRDAADSVRALANRDAIEARGPAGRGQDMGVQSNVPLPELVSSDASAAIRAARLKQVLDGQRLNEVRRQADIMRNSQTVEARRQNDMLADIRRQLDTISNSESASSTDASLPLAVSRLKASLDAQKDTQGPIAPQEQPAFSSLAGTQTGKLLEQARATERYNKRNAREQEADAKKAKKASDDAAKAKAEKKVKDAESKAKEAEKDADENLYVFEHRGVKIRVDKESVGNPKSYGISFREKTDRRMDVLDGAKALTKSDGVKKLLDQLARDWTDTTNDPSLAYGHMEELVNDKRVPKAVGEYLLDNWDRVKGTWATKRRELEDD